MMKKTAMFALTGLLLATAATAQIEIEYELDGTPDGIVPPHPELPRIDREIVSPPVAGATVLYLLVTNNNDWDVPLDIELVGLDPGCQPGLEHTILPSYPPGTISHAFHVCDLTPQTFFIRARGIFPEDSIVIEGAPRYATGAHDSVRLAEIVAE